MTTNHGDEVETPEDVVAKQESEIEEAKKYRRGKY